jgi:uncharacterized protein
MLKFILIFLVLAFIIGFGTLAGIVLRAFFKARSILRGSADEQESERVESRRAKRRRSNRIERMLACAVCGVHVPESEALRAQGEFFCCEAHRRARRTAGGA